MCSNMHPPCVLQLQRSVVASGEKQQKAEYRNKQEVVATPPLSSSQRHHYACMATSEVAVKPCWEAWLLHQCPEGKAQPRMNSEG